jgi:hypothetical protein
MDTLQMPEQLADMPSPTPSAKERLSDALVEIGDYIESLPASDESGGTSVADDLPKTPTEQPAGTGIYI